MGARSNPVALGLLLPELAGQSLSWNSLILSCGCLFEAGTGWDGLAGDRAGSYAESLSWNSLILSCGCLFEAGTGWDGLAGDTLLKNFEA